MTNPKDLDVLRKIAEGNETVIKNFYKENLKYIKSYILQNLGNEEDVEDVFQDAMIFLYQKITSDTFQLNCALQTYFYAVCKNMWRNQMRKNSRLFLEEEIIEIPESIETSILEELHEKEKENLYRKYFFRLHSRCIELLKLVFEGNNTKKISETTGYTEGYVRKKKFECKKSLLEMIEKDPLYKEMMADLK